MFLSCCERIVARGQVATKLRWSLVEAFLDGIDAVLFVKGIFFIEEQTLGVGNGIESTPDERTQSSSLLFSIFSYTRNKE